MALTNKIAVVNFSANIEFPYFTQGKSIKITGLDLYGQDVTKPYSVGDHDAATKDLNNLSQYILSAKRDAVGPTQVSTQVFLIIRYSLDGS